MGISFKFAAALITLFPALGVKAQTGEQSANLVQDQQYCYALASMANITVLNRNAGKTLQEQLERRRTSLGPESAEFKLVQSIATQIYEKDLKAPLPVASDTLRSCLQARDIAGLFSPKAIETCPAVGLLVAEVSASRRKGATLEQIGALVGDRYGDLRNTVGGGLEKLAARYAQGSRPDSGVSDYSLCMTQHMGK